MHLETLRVTDLRCFGTASLALAPGLNLFLGPNGSGKTSLIEAAYLLSHGNSFRRGARDALVRRGADGFVVFGAWRARDGAPFRLGLERRGGQWTARIDDEPVRRLSDLFLRCAVCCFEPGSHALVGGAPEERRSYWDWTLFHVEPAFLETWRRYQRALKQRNALLRQQAPDTAFEPWDLELATSGEALGRMRAVVLDRIESVFAHTAARLLPELGEARLPAEPGWDTGAEDGLRGELARRLPLDRVRGSTSRGPHRADFRPTFVGAPQREHLSRGQEKLTALALILAQATLFRDVRGEWPVLAFDDLPSELDFAHQAHVLDALAGQGAQVLVTATEASPPLAARLAEAAVFHVEHGNVSPAGAPPG
ncbi:MAG TPA: DNA replication/repair protein RecF [Xanthomonadales bacterium]|nr:DNA replication/repair protein RecF [Xanthomonadales bacterium]